jgi:hypothetical protein
MIVIIIITAKAVPGQYLINAFAAGTAEVFFRAAVTTCHAIVAAMIAGRFIKSGALGHSVRLSRKAA